MLTVGLAGCAQSLLCRDQAGTRLLHNDGDEVILSVSLTHSRVSAFTLHRLPRSGFLPSSSPTPFSRALLAGLKALLLAALWN